MSTRVRNPEIYVKGYGKNTTKDDLKSWFKEFGKIICIQYKGPYSFIVTHVSLRNSRTIMMLNQQWRRWTTKRWRDSAWLWSPQGRSAMDQVIAPEAAVVTTRRSTAEDAGNTHSYAVLHHPAPLRLLPGAQAHHLQTLAHPLQWTTRIVTNQSLRKNRRSDWLFE